MNMNARAGILACSLLVAQLGFAVEPDAVKWDPRMAVEYAAVDTNGVKWIDGKYLPLEGRAFDNTEAYYDRMPSDVTEAVNGGVRTMKHHTSGMMFRFRTDSPFLHFKWTPYSGALSMDHMPSTGVSGIDVYRFDTAAGTWRYVKTGRIRDASKGGSLRIEWTPGDACLVNLPLYNGLKDFALGLDSAATVEALGPRASGVNKPVVFYGTSITHGGCASRPGLAFVNRVGRDLDVPVVGLGFSDSGAMELEMSEHLAKIDASCYVLDCLGNMGMLAKPYKGRCVDRDYEPFIRNLRAKRPDVPIVMAEHCDVFCRGLDDRDRFVRKLYEKLVSEGWKNLVHLPKFGMLGSDYEGTVDGVHPNDLGMKSMAVAYGRAVREALFRPLSVVADETGALSVVADGKTLVSSIRMDMGDDTGFRSTVTSCERLDGTRVWNETCTERRHRYRIETGARADGAVEITMVSEADIDCTPCDRFLELTVPPGVLTPDCGALGDRPLPPDLSNPSNHSNLPSVTTNWFAANGFTFDFNPMGSINEIGLRPVGEGWSHIDCVKGMATLAPQPDGSVKIRLGARNGSPFGGYTGAKIVIRRGQDADFDKYHFRRRCHYADTLPARHLLAFGSPKRGAAYGEGNVGFNDKRGYGWLKRKDSTVQPSTFNLQPHPVIGYKEGAYYSALAGSGEATYRFGNLADGWYFLTFAAGNYAGVENSFVVNVNGESWSQKLELEKGMLRRIVRAVHVTGGHLDVTFTGDWLVSVLALQPFMGDGEDFSLNRGFWLTKGYEPGVLYQSADFPGPVVPGVSDTTDPLPVPGQECAGPRKELVRETELPPADHPGIAWTKTANLQRFQDQCAVFALGDKKMRADFIRRECTEKGVTAVMMSGLQNRFNWPRASENALGVIGELVDEFHRQGIRVIDHIDTTLRTSGTSWRQMVEHPDAQMVERETGLISYQLCTANAYVKEMTYPYFRKIVAAGVDGFQIDENYMWRKGCLCHACCERFRRETGWQIPLNECSEQWADIYTPFFLALRDWRNFVCTGFFIDLRRYVKDLNDHLVFSAYPTYGGFITESCNTLGQDIGDLMRVVNFFGLEMMSRSFMRNVRCELPDLHTMKTHGELHGAPVWNWYYNFDWQNDYAAWSVSLLAGCVPMLSRVAHPAGTPDYVSETGKFVARLGESRPLAEIGVYFSTRTREARDGTENWKERVFPAMEMMDELNIPYAVVPDFNISDDRIKDYKVMYLCGADILTEEEKKVFKRFEQRGGRIVRGQESDREFDFNFRSAGLTYTYDPDPAREAAFRERLRKDLAGATWWTVDAPKQVFSSVRRLKDGSIAIQFFNQTGVKNKVGEVWPFFAPDPAYPSLEKDIVFTLKSSNLHITASSPDFAGERELACTTNADGTLTVRLPKELLKTYVFIRLLMR